MAFCSASKKKDQFLLLMRIIPNLNAISSQFINLLRKIVAVDLGSYLAIPFFFPRFDHGYCNM